MPRCPISFPTLRSASLYIAAERALSKRERERGNIAYDGGFAILRDTQTPVVDTVARSARQGRRLEDAARLGGGL